MLNLAKCRAMRFLPQSLMQCHDFGRVKGSGALSWSKMLLLITLFVSASLGASVTQAQIGFSARNISLPAISQGYECSAAWVDINNDGRLDFAYTGGNDLTGPAVAVTKVFVQQVDQSFSLASTGLPNALGSCFAWGDYDNDGYQDVYLSGMDTDSNPLGGIYRNNTDGTFSAVASSVPIAVNGASASWGDYDNDGDLDLVVAAGTSGADIYRNDGGSFNAISAGLAQESGKPQFADYDHDGDLDVILASEGMFDANFRIYSNNGSGVFSNANIVLPNLTAPLTSPYVYFGDFEGDGDGDLLYIGLGDGYIYLNNGQGGFTQYASGLSGVIGWVDYDNDGDLDPYGNSLYINNYPSQIDFSLSFPFPNAGPSYSIAWGDYDGDGDRDYFYVGAGYFGLGAGDVVITQGAVSGYVAMEDTTPLAGVTFSSVALGNVVSENDGTFSILNIAYATPYTLSPSLDGYAFNPSSYTGILRGIHYLTFVATVAYDIGGTVTIGGSPLAGVTVNGGALGTKTTDVNGAYRFDNVATGTVYNLTLAGPTSGYSFTPNGASGTLTQDVIHNFSADACPDDSAKYTPGICGCGIPDSDVGDIDQDSIPNCIDTSDDSCRLIDTDGDGISSCDDQCPNDASKSAPGQCGCALPENIGDDDGDGVINCLDFSDGGDGNTVDTDADGDGVSDEEDACPSDPLKQQAGFCGCGVAESLLDTDRDGIKDCADADDDNDGYSDQAEILAGTNTTDRGSRPQAPDVSTNQEICADWSGSGGVYENYLELYSRSSQLTSVKATLYSSDGSVAKDRRLNVSPYGTTDLAIHSMSGWTNAATGQFCSALRGSSGGFDGQVVYYLRDTADDTVGAVASVYSRQLTNGMSGKQWVSYNTIQPSEHEADRQNLVSNWFQIRSMNASRQSGEVSVYNSAGRRVSVRDIKIKPRGTFDLALHGYGQKRIGAVKWVPADTASKFQVGVVRYYHSGSDSLSDVEVATHIEGQTGIGESISGIIDNVSNSSVIEMINTSSRKQKVTVSLYRTGGTRDADASKDGKAPKAVIAKSYQLNANSSFHLLIASLMPDSLGYATLKGEYPEGLVAYVVSYGKQKSSEDGSTADNSLQDVSGPSHIYALSLSQPIAGTLKGLYNTNLAQGCLIQIANPNSSKLNLQLKLLNNKGENVSRTTKLGLNARETLSYNLCSVAVPDSSGTVVVTASDKVVASLLRTGAENKYRFATRLR